MTKSSAISLSDQPSLMRASRLHGIRDMRLDKLPQPVPGPGEVLLQVASVGVCGSDVHYYLHGRIGTQIVTAPIIMGHEFSARVAGLGPGVEDLTIGQLVTVEPGSMTGAGAPCIGISRPLLSLMCIFFLYAAATQCQASAAARVRIYVQ